MRNLIALVFLSSAFSTAFAATFEERKKIANEKMRTEIEVSQRTSVASDQAVKEAVLKQLDLVNRIIDENLKKTVCRTVPTGEGWAINQQCMNEVTIEETQVGDWDIFYNVLEPIYRLPIKKIVTYAKLTCEVNYQVAGASSGVEKIDRPHAYGTTCIDSDNNRISYPDGGDYVGFASAMSAEQIYFVKANEATRQNSLDNTLKNMQDDQRPRRVKEPCCGVL